MPSYLTFALMTPLLGLSALTMITAANTFMQLHTDPGMRGRVMALYMMIFIGGTPLGAPLIGWIGEVSGARWTLLGGAATIARRARGHRGLPLDPAGSRGHARGAGAAGSPGDDRGAEGVRLSGVGPPGRRFDPGSGAE